MHISSSRFAGRETISQQIEPKSTYFLIFEGTKTEPIYFEKLIDFAYKEIKNVLIKIEIIEREHDEVGISNPAKIVGLVAKKVDEWKEVGILSFPGGRKVCYSEGIDKICLLFDRDRKSFTDSQYEQVLTVCWEKDLHPYVSNPNFEFWLLLHFDEVFYLDDDLLLDNEKIGGKTFTERELSKLISYSKSSYDVYPLLSRIDKAIKNEAQFCENIEQLRDKVGSNVGKLVSEIMNKQKTDMI